MNVGISNAPVERFVPELVADYPELVMQPATSEGPVLDSRTLSGFGGGQWLVWTVTGHVALRVTRTAGANALVSGLFLGPTVNLQNPVSAIPPVVFTTTDTVTKGTWKGAYGSTGTYIAADPPAVGLGTNVGLTGGSEWTWYTSTSDPRALQRTSSTDRLMSAWYGETFTFDVSVGAESRQLALYAADFDNAGRTQRIDLFVAAEDQATVILAGWELGAFMLDVIGGATVPVKTIAFDTFPSNDAGTGHFRIPAELLPVAGTAFTIALRYKLWTSPDETKPHIESFTNWVPATQRIVKLPDGTLVIQ